MNYHKKKLICFLIIATMLAIANKAFDHSAFTDGLVSIDWIYWSGMAIIFYLTYYVFAFKCPNPECRKQQIYRSVSPKDWHWPSDKCFSCGTNIKVTNKKNV